MPPAPCRPPFQAPRCQIVWQGRPGAGRQGDRQSGAEPFRKTHHPDSPCPEPVAHPPLKRKRRPASDHPSPQRSSLPRRVACARFLCEWLWGALSCEVGVVGNYPTHSISIADSERVVGRGMRRRGVGSVGKNVRGFPDAEHELMRGTSGALTPLAASRGPGRSARGRPGCAGRASLASGLCRSPPS